MKSTSTDPRAMRTRALLREALMQNVIEKPFRDVTIRDITKQAGVNRATFYLHYEDKYDLLEDCAAHLVNEIRATIPPGIRANPLNPPQVPFEQHHARMVIILEHFRQHSDFYRAIFGKDGDPLFFNLFRDNASVWLQSLLKEVLTHHNKPIDEGLIEMMVRFQSAGNFDVIIWWLENDMSVPIDVMSRRLSVITMPPLIRLIKGENIDPSK